MITTKEFVEQALATEAPITEELVQRMTLEARSIHALMGMMTELGELVDVFKKYIFYNVPIDHVNVVEEIGDKLWYFAIMLNIMGIRFEEVMEINICKLRTRFPDRFTEYDAKHRDLKKEMETLETKIIDISR